jgi:hypothetical protein
MEMFDAKYPSRLDYGWTRRHEKNWIGFAYKEDMYFVYQIVPHTILRADPLTGKVERLYETSFGNIVSLTRALGDDGLDGSLRGSASAGEAKISSHITSHFK